MATQDHVEYNFLSCQLQSQRQKNDSFVGNLIWQMVKNINIA